MNTVSQWFSSLWDSVSNFCVKVFNFLVDTFGFTVAVIQACIIGLLVVLLFVFLIIAIINPAKRRKRKLEKIYKKQREIEKIRQRISELSNEITAINIEIALNEKQAEDEIFTLTQEEKLISKQENALNVKGQNKIEELAQKQKILNEYLKNQQRGIFKSMKKAETTKKLINDIDAEKSVYVQDISLRTTNSATRKQELAETINKINAEKNLKHLKLTEQRNTLLKEKLALELTLEEKLVSGKHVMTMASAKAMADEYAKQQRLIDKEAEDKALESLRKAKAEYEAAYKKRIQTEKDTSLAIENVKAIQSERAKANSNKKLSYAPITQATAVRSDEKPKDVTIIIADINGEILSVQEPEDVEIVEVDERAYVEPIVEVVDISKLTEEEVIFIEAILEDINFDADDETILNESAITETENLAFNTQETPLEAENQTTDLPTEEVAQPADEVENTQQVEVVDEVAQTQTETTQEVEQTEIVEETEQVADENVIELTGNDQLTQAPIVEEDLTAPLVDEVIEVIPIVKKKPAGKIYNDGIPATPIHKKSKYEKPITRIVRKTPSKKSVFTPTAIETTAEKVKIGYNGKWQISKTENGYKAKLLASNGGLMLSLAEYSTDKAIKSAIENVKTALSSKNVKIVTVKNKSYVFKILSAKGRTIAQSAEYTTKLQCEKALDSTTRFSQTAIICE